MLPMSLEEFELLNDRITICFEQLENANNGWKKVYTERERRWSAIERRLNAVEESQKSLGFGLSSRGYEIAKSTYRITRLEKWSYWMLLAISALTCVLITLGILIDMKGI